MSVTDQRERRPHFRGKPRPGRRIEISYQVAGGTATTAFTRNIGVGGAFIVTTAPPPPGTVLTLALRLPTAKQPIEVQAEVRWHGDSAEGTPGGMGVKFHGLEVEELLQLNEYFASLTGTEEA